MSLIREPYNLAARFLGISLVGTVLGVAVPAQTVATTTVQGTVYLANGTPGSGTLQISWPAFNTAANQAVTAGSLTANIGTDGSVSVNLAPNLGSSPAGLFYTAVYHMSDGTTSTEYWVVPAAAQASIAQVRSQVMPAAQAIQAASKAYVDQAVQSSGTVNNGSAGQIAYYNGNGTAVSGTSAVPVSAGGTGASTAAGALAALGGASLSATSVQNFAGPINATVNTQFNVTAYGAKGDCVTDDNAAITAAQAAALAMGAAYRQTPAAIYFPKAPGGCYLTSTFQWKGVSIEGQPSGQASSSNGVIIKGKPGQDVVHVQDPTTTAYPPGSWNQSWSIHNITFVVDDTAASTFPHRWPGRWFDDGAMTSGSAIFTTARGQITCGDVGQAIQVNGAGLSGGNLVTTIASVNPCWATAGGTAWQQVTLAASASTTVSNAHTYVSVLGLPVTATIGAAGLAFDDVDGNGADWVSSNAGPGNAYDILDNVGFTSVSYADGGQNNTAAIYIQGGGFYGLDARNIQVTRLQYGVVQGCPELNSYDQTCSNDYQHWSHMLFNGETYPWISYNGLQGHMDSAEFTTNNGPQFLQLTNQYQDAFNGWTFDLSQFEGETGIGWRLTGTGAVMSQVNLGTAQIDAMQTRCTLCTLNGGSNINGTDNDFQLYNNSYTNGLNDQGLGNRFLSGAVSANPYLGIEPGYLYPSEPQKQIQPVAGLLKSDFLQDGNTTPYNRDDMFIWPRDARWQTYGTAGEWTTYFTLDSASPTGTALIMPAGWAPTTYGQYENQTGLVVGSGFPAAGTGTLFWAAKCPSASTFSMRVLAGATTTNTQGGLSCTTSYQVYSMRFNASAYQGQGLWFSPGSGSTIWLAYAYFRPDIADINGIPVANFAQLASPALTGTPTAPTQSGCSGTTQIATSQYVANCGGGGAALSQWVSPGIARDGSIAVAANATTLYDFVLPGSLSATKISYSIQTADNTSDTYDLGVYSNSGALLCHTGATAGTTFAPSTGPHTLSFLSTCNLTGGTRYYFAFTGSASTAVLYHGGNVMLASSGANPTSGNATTGGALNSSVTPAADAWADTNGFPEISLHN